MKFRFARSSAIALGMMISVVRADEGSKLRELLASEWEYTMAENPSWASALGDRRWNDKWTDESAEHLARQAEHDRELLTKLEGIDRLQLPAEDRLNYDMKKYGATLALDEYAQRLWTLPMNQREGVQLLDESTNSLRFETVKDYEDWIARLRAVPEVVDQTMALMRLGIAEKRTHAKVALEGVAGQIAKQIVEKPEESPFFKPFQKMAAEISPADRERLPAAAREAISGKVVPAYRRFSDFFTKEYFPACTEEPGAWQWPHGPEAYAFLARKFTTTNLTPDEIHAIGLREVDRITQEMQTIMDQVGWKGSRQEFFEYLRHEPKFYYRTPEELLEGYRAVAKRIDPTLVKVLKTLPRAPYGVEPIPAISAPNTTAAYYRPLAADGSRAGTFCVNLYRPAMRPKYEMMALALHESVPGHHLQFAVAYEQGDLPNFRRYGGDGAYTAYIEGWALYAESLGDELGLYDDPYSKFGQLTYEIWRACRLVVDTGIHAKHWSRQQAIDFLLDHSAKTVLDVDNEIDRYISWPGQALAYKIGELKIKELRERAKKALGEKFDPRDFHEVVLHSGPVPLEVLERNVDEWLAAQTSPKP
jgi:uncharacterized protein (DUF885 family)